VRDLARPSSPLLCGPYTRIPQEIDHARRDRLRAFLVGGDYQVGVCARRREPFELAGLEPGWELGLSARGDRARLGMEQDQSCRLATVTPQLPNDRMLLGHGAGRVAERGEPGDQGRLA